jgi:hypothetical protein
MDKYIFSNSSRARGKVEKRASGTICGQAIRAEGNRWVIGVWQFPPASVGGRWITFAWLTSGPFRSIDPASRRKSPTHIWGGGLLSAPHLENDKPTYVTTTTVIPKIGPLSTLIGHLSTSIMPNIGLPPERTPIYSHWFCRSPASYPQKRRFIHRYHLLFHNLDWVIGLLFCIVMPKCGFWGLELVKNKTRGKTGFPLVS